jgi:hypothetical protein
MEFHAPPRTHFANFPTPLNNPLLSEDLVALEEAPVAAIAAEAGRGV